MDKLLTPKYLHAGITHQILGAAFEVQRALGPGLLESAYRGCLAKELEVRRLSVRQEVGIPVRFKGFELDCGYRIDLIVGDAVIVELKSVEKLLPIHDAQLLTYLKLSKLRVGLLINFNTAPLRRGVRRLVI